MLTTLVYITLPVAILLFIWEILREEVPPFVKDARAFLATYVRAL
jgi:hypothetical protein